MKSVIVSNISHVHQGISIALTLKQLGHARNLWLLMFQQISSTIAAAASYFHQDINNITTSPLNHHDEKTCWTLAEAANISFWIRVSMRNSYTHHRPKPNI